MSTTFRNRSDAGRQLARRLARYTGLADVTVLALPRGGVPVGYEVALALRAPLDVFVVRKLGVPGQEELAMGAVASGGSCVLNNDVVQALGVPSQTIAAIAARELREVERRERAYRGNRAAPDVRGRTVIVVDDGLATGSTMRAAVAALRRLGPARIVAAVPVAARESLAELAPLVDQCVCEITPEPFHAVGLWYDDFTPTADDEVRELLEGAASPSIRTSERVLDVTESEPLPAHNGEGRSS
ncbi:MAG: phosphoribosyltransferase [Isosphaeraceae bacterium]|nr:phosphoribosyltransferase [Isosphaeraceae bacterium]